MSTLAAAVQTIETVLAATVSDPTRIAWPNVPFTPPAIGPWIKLDIVWGIGTVWTKDGATGLSATTGILQLAVFAPRDTGDGALDLEIAVPRALFHRQRMGDLWFGAASGPVRLVEEAWRSLVVSIPFRVLEP